MGKKIFLNRDWKFWEKFQDDMIRKKMEGGACVSIPHTCRETRFQHIRGFLFRRIAGVITWYFLHLREWHMRQMFI